jgi:hypothetical protein
VSVLSPKKEIARANPWEESAVSGETVSRNSSTIAAPCGVVGHAQPDRQTGTTWANGLHAVFVTGWDREDSDFCSK